MNLKNILFISKRLTSQDGSQESAKQVVVSVRVAIVSVVVSIVVMTISSAVVLGFRDVISSRILDFAADFQIVSRESVVDGESQSISMNSGFVDAVRSIEGVSRVSPYVEKPLLLRSEAGVKGVVFKGLSNSYDTTTLHKYLIKGALIDLQSESVNKSILLSELLAKELRVDVGQSIEVVYIQHNARRDKFTVCGLFSSQLPDLDEAIVFGDMRSMQRINKWDANEVSGFSVSLSSRSDYDKIVDSLQEIVYLFSSGKDVAKLTETTKTYDYLFGWLDMHKTNELVIIVIMMMVSIFNVISMTLILLLQRTSMIGLLKSMGMKSFDIQLLFVARSWYYIFIGLVVGNLLAILLCLAQQHLNIIELDATAYMTSTVPILIDTSKLVAMNIAMVISLFVAQLITTHIITKMEPYKAIKYEKR